MSDDGLWTYFYGLAANPLTKAHERIVRSILEESNAYKMIIGVTDHDYKKFAFPFQIRMEMAEAVFKDLVDAGRVQLVRQDRRTWRFLTESLPQVDGIIVGEDEWQDLMDGKWSKSQDILETWPVRVMMRTDGISSTKVRELIDKGLPLDDVLPKKVIEIINANR